MRLGLSAILAAALMLTACGNTGQSIFSASETPEIKRAPFILSVKEEPNLSPGVPGTATFVEGSNVCLIKLREYPRCLLHEVRHCIEGEWHRRDVPNGEDCWN